MIFWFRLVFWFGLMIFLVQIGCKTKWDVWSDQDKLPCTSVDQYRFSFPIRTWILFREYESIFNELDQAESDEIRQITGCRKPCKYKRYSFLGDPFPSAFESEHPFFALWAVSNKTKVETEELVYPSSSLVAELGGTLGLFLGFSFISLWDKLGALRRFVWNLIRVVSPLCIWLCVVGYQIFFNINEIS